ncbi:MAG: hypothetical protein DCC58_15970 [Chloroflexi bacterium]|nr:MAG: hypothetical protein DCC58_15970 [Chloroflexota bacterium]
MRPRDLAWPLLSAIAGVGAIYLFRLGLGHWPHGVVSTGIILVAVGVGLIGARFSRLGPFEGELGAPWFENDLRETLAWEYDRASRYGRVVTVVVLRQRPGAPMWDAVVRAVDRVISCSNNWLIMILPETNREGALSMLHRLTESGGIDHAAVLQLPRDLDERDQLPAAILGVMRQEALPGSVLVFQPGGSEALPIRA